ncbi:unnamed protein product [Sphagnum jensenii]|uniref:Uncharacterized protein n=1 Tax=Sphagnum jensenii TaxID=128206 RepID=A0ABP0VAP2_9BRYO
MSSMSSNPAGLALYRSHEFAISGGGIWGGTNSTYQGQASSASFSKATLSQAGFVFATRKLSRYDNLSYNRGGSALDRFVIGFGYQKLADYNRTDYIYGSNSSNSYAGAMASSLNANQNPINVNNFSIPTVNGYNSGLLTYPDTATDFLAPRMGLPINQVGTITTQGSMNELSLTMGFNVGNTIYIGAGLGVPYVSYHRYVNFQEYNNAQDSSYSSQYNYSLTGWGVNGKLGIIVKPVQWLRLGAAVQSPTVYRLSESDWGATQSLFADSAYGSQSNLNYQFTYNNPLKGTFGASFYLKQWGFLSVDYELNDYGHTRYTFDGSDRSTSDEINKNINSMYKLASTVKAGAEFAYKSLRLRAGFAWSESPFKNSLAPSGYDGARFNYTAGIGYRGKRFFADLAYVRTQYKDYYTPYSYTDAQGNLQAPGVLNSFSSNTIIATIGFKFGVNRN